MTKPSQNVISRVCDADRKDSLRNVLTTADIKDLYEGDKMSHPIAENELPEVLKLKDIASYLRISEPTARKLAKSPDFPAVWISKTTFRVERTAFLNWVKQARPRNAAV